MMLDILLMLNNNINAEFSLIKIDSNQILHINHNHYAIWIATNFYLTYKHTKRDRQTQRYRHTRTHWNINWPVTKLIILPGYDI